MKTLAEYSFALVPNGFWSTVFCLFPPWAFYLVVEFFFHRYFK